MYELEGTIKVIFESQTFDSGFTKRDFVITTDDRFPQDIKLECIKEKVELLDSLAEGDRVKASFNLRGNEYRERYYVNLQAWKLEKQGEGGAPSDAPGEAPPLPDDEPAPDDDDDLPF